MIRINVSTASTSVVDNLVIALYYSGTIKCEIDLRGSWPAAHRGQSGPPCKPALMCL
jgi:hypothetical protein